MTPEALQAIRERCEKATPGPWTISGDDLYHQIDSKMDAVMTDSFCYAPEGKENANFIAHARQDIPALLEHIKAQEEEIEGLKRGGRIHEGI